jgi:hypothetical protein
MRMACDETKRKVATPHDKLPYSRLSVQFIDKFGVQYVFLVEDEKWQFKYTGVARVMRLYRCCWQ